VTWSQDAPVMAERHIILLFADGKWSAAYSDRPEDRFYGAAMDAAIASLKQARPGVNDVERQSDMTGPLEPPP